MNTWILENIGARSRRRVVAWAVAAACVGTLAASQSRYLSNFFGGPYELGSADLETITDVSHAPRYFATVTGVDALETGLQEITVTEQNGHETDRRVSAEYYALVVDDRFLVFKSHSGSRTTVEGELRPMPLDMQSELFKPAEIAAVRHRFYPFYLDDESFRFAGYWGLGGLALFGVLLLTLGRREWTRMKDPASHPLAQRVQAWGDPLGTAVAAQRQSRSPKVKGRGGWVLTNDFLMRSTFFTFDILRVGDLLWAYKKVTKHSVNFIPTGKTYEAVLVCDGGSATVPANEKTVDRILTAAAERTPWAIFGFSKEIESAFKTDIQGFRAVVEERRQQATAPQPAA